MKEHRKKLLTSCKAIYTQVLSEEVYGERVRKRGREGGEGERDGRTKRSECIALLMNV